MKRKIDDLREDKPPITLPDADAKPPPDAAFTDFGLDSRILTAIAGQGFHKPTTPQALAIPQILDGTSVVLRAKTGSGKTLCYLLPLIESILRSKGAAQQSTSVLVLVPTRELADQVLRTIETFTAFCQKDVRAIKLSEQLPDEVVRSMLASTPHIVVATPSRACAGLKISPSWTSKLNMVVIDESDLVLSYGYEEDLATLAASIPKGVQAILTSATLTSDVDRLKDQFCKSPSVLDLNEPEAEGEGITQYVVECGEDDKFLLIYVLLKLKLIRGKCLIFVTDDVDRSYRLKLYLEQFGIRSAVLNSQLPIASRVHTVQQFNQGLFDILISSDEMEVLGDEVDSVAADGSALNAGLDGEVSSEKFGTETQTIPPKKKRKSSRRDKDYGVSRGIDFRNVAIVVNFDCPSTARSYAHRIGRTARAGQTGTSLTMVVPSDKFRKHIPTSIPSAENDEKTLSKIKKQQAASGKELKPWHFDWKTLEGFRYRVNDALRAVTKVAVREARMREIRQELLKSEKLQRRFEENPAELHALRHDGQLRSARTQPHLKDVPDYLLPEGKKKLTASDIGFVPMRKTDGKNRKGRAFKGKGKRSGSRRIDPLRSFKAKPKAK